MTSLLSVVFFREGGKDDSGDGDCDSTNGDASDIPLPADPPPPLDKSPPLTGNTSPSQGKMGVVSFSLPKKSAPKIPATSVFAENSKSDNKVASGKSSGTTTVKNGDAVQEDAHGESTSPQSASSGSAITGPEEEREPCEDARDEFYHRSPPDHCKIKPQLSFLRFVKSADMMNLSEGVETMTAEIPSNSNVGAGDGASTATAPERIANVNGETKDGAGDKKELLGFIKVCVKLSLECHNTNKFNLNIREVGTPKILVFPLVNLSVFYFYDHLLVRKYFLNTIKSD